MINSRNDMNDLADQIMSCLLHDEDEGKAFFFDEIVATFSPDQSST